MLRITCPDADGVAAYPLATSRVPSLLFSIAYRMVRNCGRLGNMLQDAIHSLAAGARERDFDRPRRSSSLYRQPVLHQSSASPLVCSARIRRHWLPTDRDRCGERSHHRDVGGRVRISMALPCALEASESQSSGLYFPPFGLLEVFD